MAQEVRSSQSGTATFDFSSHTGVMNILRAVRDSECSLEVKNELRDLIFLYANSGGDQAIRNSLSEQLQFHNVQVPAAATTKDQSANLTRQHHGFASARPVPKTFTTEPATQKVAAKVPATPLVENRSTPQMTSTPAVNTVPQPAVTTAESVSESKNPSQPPTTTSTPAARPKVEPNLPTPAVATSNAATSPASTPTPTPSPGTPASSQVNNPAAPSTPAAPANATPPAVPQPSAPAEASTPASQSTLAPVRSAAPQTPPVSDQSALERIKIIKGDVNKRFGNPVNLVDLDNTVGREYMSALLEAMKIVSNGSPIAIKDAMDRLETVYASTQKINPDQAAVTTNVSTAPSNPNPKDAPATTQSPVTPVTTPQPQVSNLTPGASTTSNIAPAKVPVKTAANQTSAPSANQVPTPTVSAASTPADTATATKQAVPTAVPTQSATPTQPAIAKQTPLQPNSAPTETAAQQTVVDPLTGWPPKETAATPSDTASVPVQSAAASQSAAYPASVAEAEPLHTPDELPDPKSVMNSSVNGDPLYTPQIDAGLQQLLEEWPLFNKSGIFGTGPKGREHPLYKKIADLPIPLILSGRFEGATPTIKQSVTDYMNGWRYEQGILYQKGETFEQYLRRVIKQIIDWQ